MRKVLADPGRYAEAYTEAAPVVAEWTWDKQADVLDAVYASLVPEPPTG